MSDCLNEQQPVMRAVIYCRVSSQTQRDRHTIASQLRVLPEFVTSRGWELVHTADHYVDDGFTAKAGALDERKGLAKLLSDAESGAFEIVAVVDQDRLTRSEDLIERGYVLGSLQRSGVRIAVQSSGQVLDLSSSEGDLLSSLQAFFSAEENRKRRARTVQGKITAIKRGRKPSGPTPYGYLYDRATGAWSLDPDQAAIVRELFERVAAGESCHSLARALNERGVARPRSGSWQHSRVNQIVRQRGYVGHYTADKQRGLIIEVPRIVGDWLFEQAQVALEQNRFHHNPKSNHFSLAQGLGVCGLCGADILITGNRLKKRYYVCRSKKQMGKGVERCPNPMRQVEVADEQIWSAVRRVLERPDLLDDAVQLRRDQSKQVDWQAEFQVLTEKIARLDRSVETVLAQHRKGRIPDQILDRELETIDRERSVLERQREMAEQQLRSVERTEQEARRLLHTVESLKAKLETASPEDRQRLVRLLIPGRDGYHITFERDGLTLAGVLRSEPGGKAGLKKSGSGEQEGGAGQKGASEAVFQSDGEATRYGVPEDAATLRFRLVV